MTCRPPKGASVEPSERRPGGRDEISSSIDPGRWPRVQVPDENPVRRGGSGQAPSVGRDRERRDVGPMVSRDRPVDPAVKGVAEGDPAVWLSDHEESPIGRRHDEAEPPDDVAQPRPHRVGSQVPAPDGPDAAGVAGDDGKESAMVHERHHPELVTEDALLPGEEPAVGDGPERSSFLPVDVGSVRHGSEDRPSGEKASHSAASVPRRTARKHPGDASQRIIPPAASHEARVRPSGDSSTRGPARHGGRAAPRRGG